MTRRGEKERYVSPGILNQEYYQISPEILAKFPRHRPPLTLYLYKEEACSLVPVALCGQFLSKERHEELVAQCCEGNLFVSRADHGVYARHISEQLDLVLVDKTLSGEEIVEIFRFSLTKRIGEFFDQPVSPVLERLTADLLVLTEYLWQDRTRIRGLLGQLFTEDGIIRHEYNVAVTGLGLYLGSCGGTPDRGQLDRLALGLFTHDLGLSKVPAYYRLGVAHALKRKSLPLTGEEEQKIDRHPAVGAELLRKLGIAAEDVLECAMDHHERMDGSGYPRKKRGPEIGLFGRITAVADSFSAMIGHRPYAPAMPMDEACALLARDQRYDPRLTALLQSIVAGG